MYISMKFEEKVKSYSKLGQKLVCLIFFLIVLESLKKIPNFKTFQTECLWNFLLVVFKVTKSNCISKISSPFQYISIQCYLAIFLLFL